MKHFASRYLPEGTNHMRGGEELSELPLPFSWVRRGREFHVVTPASPSNNLESLDVANLRLKELQLHAKNGGWGGPRV